MATIIPPLEKAQRLLVAANEKRSALMDRLNAAVDRRDKAHDRRTEVVASIANGGSNVDLHEVSAALHASQYEVDALAGAIDLVDKEIRRAEGAVSTEQTRNARRQLRQAIKGYVAVCEEGDEVGKIIRQHTEKHKAALHSVEEAMGSTQFAGLELITILRNHHDKVAFIPRDLQGAILQIGSTVNFSLADRGRSTCNGLLMQLTSQIGDTESNGETQ